MSMLLCMSTTNNGEGFMPQIALKEVADFKCNAPAGIYVILLHVYSCTKWFGIKPMDFQHLHLYYIYSI